MTIPFLDLFKKLSSRFSSGAAETEVRTQPMAPVVRPKKSEAERLSKTVMPNATRSFSASDPFRAASSTVGTPRSGLPLELGASRITTSAVRPRGSQLPPALARALEPKVERTISLRVADLVDAVPAGFIKPVEILDTNALVSLKASEIEKGMPDKRPMISLPSLYQQVPEIFLRSVRADDDTRVELPYEKVLANFQSAHVRADQLRDPTVPHVDTPILAATIEDSERFGTKVDPIEASPTPVPVKHATARAIADAEPDATPAEPQEAVTSTSSGQKVISLHSPELRSKSDTPEPSPAESEIPFELSPNGTGASASERVPASSGPPVPTPLPFTPELEKIPLQPPPEKPVTSPPSKLPVTEPVTRPMKTTVGGPVKPPPAETITESPISLPPVVSASAKEAPSMSFSLKPLLQNLPAFQLNGDIAAVSEDARITLPLALIEPQLASGRVSIAPDVFQAALPEEHRGLFQVDVAKTPVALPLEEVLKNLPAAILKLRDDQEEIAHDKDFETPFLAKAREDAKRFTPKPAEKDAGEKKPAAQSKVDIAPEAKSALERVDPKEIVAQVNALNGIKACAITFSDGLSLAGELPEKIKADGLCAMAPSVLERIAQHVRGTKLGQLVAMTLYASDSAVSFFAKGSVCLTALHEGSLGPETRARLAHLVEKLSKTYAQPESSNVDH
jgi:predicted regulator of Ras-like GTPase activity (Roadblock/LC7/MglB family)